MRHVEFSSSKMEEKLFYTRINLIVCPLRLFSHVVFFGAVPLHFIMWMLDGCTYTVMVLEAQVYEIKSL